MTGWNQSDSAVGWSCRKHDRLGSAVMRRIGWRDWQSYLSRGQQCLPHGGCPHGGHGAPEAEKANAVHNATLPGDFVKLVPKFALAYDPELGLGQLAEDGRHRGEKIEVALLFRQVRERADNRCIRIGAVLGANEERV